MTMKTPSVLLIAILALFFLSCEKEDDLYDVAIATDKPIYTLTVGEEILVSLTNNSDSTIYYICTCQIYLEEYSGSQLSNDWLVHGFEECYGPVPIASGETTAFNIDFYQLYDQGHLSDALFNNTVEYQLRLDLFEEKTFKTLLTGSNIRSNKFAIVQQ